MKKITLTLFVIISCWLHTYAQDDAYTGPAKMYVRSFWNQVALLKKGGGSVTNLERAVGNIKEKDPSFSTALMETEIKTWKEKDAIKAAAVVSKEDEMKANMEKSRNETMAKIKFKKLLDEVFSAGTFSVNLSNAAAQVETYKAKTIELEGHKEDLAKYKFDPKTASEYNRFVEGMKESLSRNQDVFLKRAATILAESTGEKGANWENVYYEMQLEQLRCSASQKMFPDVPEFANASQKINAAVSKYGSLEDIYAQTQRNKIEQIKNTKLPAPVMRDAALEKMFVESFNKKFAAEYKGTATKAIILGSEWKTERNELTGIVLGRVRAGAIAYKGNDGKCYLISVVNLYQEYLGGSFQNTRMSYAQGSREMLCENVK